MTVTVKTTATTVIFSNTTEIAALRYLPLDVERCVTVADMDRNGKPVTVAAGPAGPDGECVPPPTDQGYPYVTARSAAKSFEIPIGTDWCVTVADIDRNGRPVPVDAGPAGVDGECSVPPTCSGIPAIATLISDSKASEPSKGPLPPTSLKVEFSLLSSIKASTSPIAPLASAVTQLPGKSLDSVGISILPNNRHSVIGKVAV
jgi:glucan endo-1,3-beta-D-glucosidase